MGKMYGQLSLDERIEIYRLHAGGKSQKEIAAVLRRSASTICRELQRNSKSTRSWPGGYSAARARDLALRRRRWDARFKLVRQPDLCERVREDLAMGHSPEQIAGRLALEYGHTVISHESIYRFVYHRVAQKDYLNRLLPRAKHRRGRKGRQGGSAASFIKLRRPIAERPASVEDRNQAGHWEADFALFAKYGQNLLVLHERTTRFTIVVHTPNRKAPLTAATITEKLIDLPAAMRRTISFDNGTEFAEHHRLHEPLQVETFFCDPHSPWQKGGLENTIGRLRRSLPRKTNLDTIGHDAIVQSIARLNQTPRKCLGFITPEEAFFALKSSIALQS